MPRSEHRPKCHDRGDRLDSYSEDDRSANEREAAAHDNRGAVELDASRGRPRVHHGRWTTRALLADFPHGYPDELARRITDRTSGSPPSASFVSERDPCSAAARTGSEPVDAGGCASRTTRSKTGAVSGSRLPLKRCRA